mmetsp:Transcript_9843/g.29759  ORF Transcript_9843/g.29759 Transcript_9843/m.29759 type:complete len:211 (+) Transcript_9843:277-909(+)
MSGLPWYKHLAVLLGEQHRGVLCCAMHSGAMRSRHEPASARSHSRVLPLPHAMIPSTSIRSPGGVMSRMDAPVALWRCVPGLPPADCAGLPNCPTRSSAASLDNASPNVGLPPARRSALAPNEVPLGDGCTPHICARSSAQLSPKRLSHRPLSTSCCASSSATGRQKRWSKSSSGQFASSSSVCRSSAKRSALLGVWNASMNESPSVACS